LDGCNRTDDRTDDRTDLSGAQHQSELIAVDPKPRGGIAALRTDAQAAVLRARWWEKRGRQQRRRSP
jgi:hypothetical protein